MLSEWMLRIWRRSCSFGSTVPTIGTPIRSPRLYENWESIQQMRVYETRATCLDWGSRNAALFKTWSFPATQWRYCWLREVYKSIKTFHFSLSTGHGDGICSKCTYRNGISRKSSIASDIPMSKCCWASPESPLEKSVCPAIGGIERIWASTLRCGASYNVTTITKDLEIRSEQILSQISILTSCYIILYL